LSKEVRATRTATKNGAITDSVTLVVDGNSGTIAVGDVITGEGIVGLVSVITVTDQNNLVMSSTQTIANDIALTFTKFEPQTYTITGTLNVLRFGISNLTSQIGTNSILSSVATGAVSSDTASDPTLTLLGLYTGSHSGGNTRIKKIIEVGTANETTISGTGEVTFRGASNTPNGTTISITSSERFDNDLISNIKFFDQSNNEITGFNAFPSSGNTKATFNFSVITNGAVIATDVLRVTINVELSNIE